MMTQIKALEESIKHWRENLVAVQNNLDLDISPESCECCSQWFLKNCEGCPIAIKARSLFCDGTPYDRVADLAGDITPNSSEEEWNTLASAVEDEVKFLEDLYDVLRRHTNSNS